MPEATLETLVAYLRQNGQRFSLDALLQQLAAQGYDPALIEEAMTVYREEASHTAPRGLSGWSVALGCFGGLVVGALSLVSLFFGLCEGMYGDNYRAKPGFVVLAAVLALLALGAGLYPFYAQRRKR